MKKLFVLVFLLAVGGFVVGSPQTASAHVAKPSMNAVSGGGCNWSTYTTVCVSENASGYVMPDIYLNTSWACSIYVELYVDGNDYYNDYYPGCTGVGSHLYGLIRPAINGNFQVKAFDGHGTAWSPILYTQAAPVIIHSSIWGGGCNGNGYISACISLGTLPGTNYSLPQYILPDAYVYGSPCNITVALYNDAYPGGGLLAGNYFAGCYFYSGYHLELIRKSL